MGLLHLTELRVLALCALVTSKQWSAQKVYRAVKFFEAHVLGYDAVPQNCFSLGMKFCHRKGRNFAHLPKSNFTLSLGVKQAKPIRFNLSLPFEVLIDPDAAMSHRGIA